MYELITQEAYRKYLMANIESGSATLIKPVESLLELLKSETTHENNLELAASFHIESSLSTLFESVELSIIKLNDDQDYNDEDHTYFLNDVGNPTRATHEDYASLIEIYNDMVANMGIPYQAGLGEIGVTTADVVEGPTESSIRGNSSKMHVDNNVPMYV